MWPFKKKRKPKVLINSLKKSYEKVNFEDEGKMSKLHTHFLSVEKAFKKNRDNLEKQIEVINDKIDKHIEDKIDLEEIEQDSAEELKELKYRIDVDTRENRARARKLTAALHSAQFKLNMFDRESRDYQNTERLLNSLYLDLEDCSNILEYMIGSLDRNLERVRAANFFTLSLEETCKSTASTPTASTSAIPGLEDIDENGNILKESKYFEVYKSAPPKSGISKHKPWPQSSDPPEEINAYPDKPTASGTQYIKKVIDISGIVTPDYDRVFALSTGIEVAVLEKRDDDE